MRQLEYIAKKSCYSCLNWRAQDGKVAVVLFDLCHRNKLIILQMTLLIFFFPKWHEIFIIFFFTTRKALAEISSPF